MENVLNPPVCGSCKFAWQNKMIYQPSVNFYQYFVFPFIWPRNMNFFVFFLTKFNNFQKMGNFFMKSDTHPFLFFMLECLIYKLIKYNNRCEKKERVQQELIISKGGGSNQIRHFSVFLLNFRHLWVWMFFMFCI